MSKTVNKRTMTSNTYLDNDFLHGPLDKCTVACLDHWCKYHHSNRNVSMDQLGLEIKIDSYNLLFTQENEHTIKRKFA
jgi:hypothetical protein